ncbi:NAD(P)H-dependent oxidoreductase [Tropicibacter sp. R15_0]|uniref:NADPH-dependent FMN reductase n=1 Tax=Tropicibacter sp. R15_0 TaxID=2821101 RepID=UPI001ADB38B2|nr:NAD(P)H-dependent oxidoreductase [Tropicibacter sp. R15_0]MBO9465904.1 NAD(P)H-dependent oxidoreductase [Tropicibacter sp. R15_0]
MSALKLVGISGALRAGSTNTLFVKEAARLFGEAEFALGDIRFPLYDGDLESSEGIPAEVQATADLIAGADAIIVSTPEYNKSLPGVLKNAFDWISRVEGNPWQDKPVAIISAAAGRAGGERAQVATREALVYSQPRFVTGPEIGLAQSFNQFDESGALTNERTVENLQVLMDKLRAEAERG